MSRAVAIAGQPEGARRTTAPFVLTALAIALSAALLAGWVPIAFSIATVFLFAGPHNWLELRYFLTRLPARWGRSRSFFQLGIAGVVVMTGAYALLPLSASLFGWREATWVTALAVWNSALVLWIAALARMRGRQVRRRDWSWVWPVAFTLVALAWLSPYALSIGLVYLHPLVSLWFLDGELRRNRPEWLGAYRASLAAIPILLALLWWRLGSAAPLPCDDALSLRIVQHAGFGIVPAAFSSHFLVAAHTFLEMLHYSVWLVAIPAVALGGRAWDTSAIPLVQHRRGWPRAIRTALAVAALVAVVLWMCFLVDYPTTRDVYFTLALAHVLAEVPFLLRLL